MNRISTIFILMTLSVISSSLYSQEDENSQLNRLKSMRDSLRTQARVYQRQIDSLTSDIDKSRGWQRGISGLLGFDFYRSNNWKNNSNPDASSSSLNLFITAHANKKTTNYFWKNKLIVNKGWSDVDLIGPDGQKEEDGLFDNGTIDVLNFSSIYGKKLSESFAISSLGEINTSMSNFFDPGTMDLGIGATYTPSEKINFIINAFNYHLAFSGITGIRSESFLGAKIKVDFEHKLSRQVTIESILTSFIPYGDPKSDEDTSLFELSWISTASIHIWKGIGLGLSLGYRKADFESNEGQTYYAAGISFDF